MQNLTANIQIRETQIQQEQAKAHCKQCGIVSLFSLIQVSGNYFYYQTIFSKLY